MTLQHAGSWSGVVRIRSVTGALTGVRAAVAAGVLYAAAGAAIWLGIMTAEAMYDETYTTHDNEISDLGATRPPDSVSYQPSSGIFNATMVVTGVMLTGAALLVHQRYGRRGVSIPAALLGIGVLGVGIFPGNVGSIHPLFALMAFVAGGVAAVTSARVQAGPLQYASIALGATTLTALAIGMAGESTFVFRELGDGGLERWIAYPVVIWMIAFGGYLMAAGGTGADGGTS